MARLYNEIEPRPRRKMGAGLFGYSIQEIGGMDRLRMKKRQSIIAAMASINRFAGSIFSVSSSGVTS